MLQITFYRLLITNNTYNDQVAQKIGRGGGFMLSGFTRLLKRRKAIYRFVLMWVRRYAVAQNSQLS